MDEDGSYTNSLLPVQKERKQIVKQLFELALAYIGRWRLLHIETIRKVKVLVLHQQMEAVAKQEMRTSHGSRVET